jgi:hypothetical protein
MIVRKRTIMFSLVRENEKKRLGKSERRGRPDLPSLARLVTALHIIIPDTPLILLNRSFQAAEFIVQAQVE